MEDLNTSLLNVNTKFIQTQNDMMIKNDHVHVDDKGNNDDDIIDIDMTDKLKYSFSVYSYGAV